MRNGGKFIDYMKCTVQFKVKLKVWLKAPRRAIVAILDQSIRNM